MRIEYTLRFKPGGFAVVFAQGDTTGGRISREDVASVCVAALQVPDAINKTVEVFNGETSGPNPWGVLFASLVAD